MAKRLPLIAAVLAAFVVYGVGACSDSAPDRAHYITDAEQVCDRYAKLGAQIVRPTDLGDLPAQAQYLRRSADLNQQQVDELRKLTRPDADSDRLSSMYDEVTQVISTQRGVADMMERGDPQWKAKLLEMTKAARDSNAKIDAYGMKRCGSEQA